MIRIIDGELCLVLPGIPDEERETLVKACIHALRWGNEARCNNEDEAYSMRQFTILLEMLIEKK